MTNQQAPSSPLLYADAFNMTMNPWGVRINFGLMGKEGGPPGIVHTEVAMSFEHMKVMAYLMCRQVRSFEHDSGAVINVASAALEQGIKCTQDEWSMFWYGKPASEPIPTPQVTVGPGALVVVPAASEDGHKEG